MDTDTLVAAVCGAARRTAVAALPDAQLLRFKAAFGTLMLAAMLDDAELDVAVCPVLADGSARHVTVAQYAQQQLSDLHVHQDIHAKLLLYLTLTTNPSAADSVRATLAVPHLVFQEVILFWHLDHNNLIDAYDVAMQLPAIPLLPLVIRTFLVELDFYNEIQLRVRCDYRPSPDTNANDRYLAAQRTAHEAQPALSRTMIRTLFEIKGVSTDFANGPSYSILELSDVLELVKTLPVEDSIACLRSLNLQSKSCNKLLFFYYMRFLVVQFAIDVDQKHNTVALLAKSAPLTPQEIGIMMHIALSSRSLKAQNFPIVYFMQRDDFDSAAQYLHLLESHDNDDSPIEKSGIDDSILEKCIPDADAISERIQMTYMLRRTIGDPAWLYNSPENSDFGTLVINAKASTRKFLDDRVYAAIVRNGDEFLLGREPPSWIDDYYEEYVLSPIKIIDDDLIEEDEDNLEEKESLDDEVKEMDTPKHVEQSGIMPSSTDEATLPEQVDIMPSTKDEPIVPEQTVDVAPLVEDAPPVEQTDIVSPMKDAVSSPEQVGVTISQNADSIIPISSVATPSESPILASEHDGMVTVEQDENVPPSVNESPSVSRFSAAKDISGFDHFNNISPIKNAPSFVTDKSMSPDATRKEEFRDEREDSNLVSAIQERSNASILQKSIEVFRDPNIEQLDDNEEEYFNLPKSHMSDADLCLRSGIIPSTEVIDYYSPIKSQSFSARPTPDVKLVDKVSILDIPDDADASPANSRANTSQREVSVYQLNIIGSSRHSEYAMSPCSGKSKASRKGDRSDILHSLEDYELNSCAGSPASIGKKSTTSMNDHLVTPTKATCGIRENSPVVNSSPRLPMTATFEDVAASPPPTGLSRWKSLWSPRGDSVDLPKSTSLLRRLLRFKPASPAKAPTASGDKAIENTEQSTVTSEGRDSKHDAALPVDKPGGKETTTTEEVNNLPKSSTTERSSVNGEDENPFAIVQPNTEKEYEPVLRRLPSKKSQKRKFKRTPRAVKIATHEQTSEDLQTDKPNMEEAIQPVFVDENDNNIPLPIEFDSRGIKFSASKKQIDKKEKRRKAKAAALSEKLLAHDRQLLAEQIASRDVSQQSGNDDGSQSENATPSKNFGSNSKFSPLRSPFAKKQKQTSTSPAIEEEREELVANVEPQPKEDLVKMGESPEKTIETEETVMKAQEEIKELDEENVIEGNDLPAVTPLKPKNANALPPGTTPRRSSRIASKPLGEGGVVAKHHFDEMMMNEIATPRRRANSTTSKPTKEDFIIENEESIEIDILNSDSIAVDLVGKKQDTADVNEEKDDIPVLSETRSKQVEDNYVDQETEIDITGMDSVLQIPEAISRQSEHSESFAENGSDDVEKSNHIQDNASSTAGAATVSSTGYESEQREKAHSQSGASNADDSENVSPENGGGNTKNSERERRPRRKPLRFENLV